MVIFHGLSMFIVIKFTVTISAPLGYVFQVHYFYIKISNLWDVFQGIDSVHGILPTWQFQELYKETVPKDA